jgi:hypothetical protein
MDMYALRGADVNGYVAALGQEAAAASCQRLLSRYWLEGAVYDQLGRLFKRLSSQAQKQRQAHKYYRVKSAL